MRMSIQWRWLFLTNLFEQFDNNINFFLCLGWGTVVYQCIGNQRREDVEKLEWDKTTRKLPGEHGCGFYTSFRYDEGGDGPDNYETSRWTKPLS